MKGWWEAQPSNAPEPTNGTRSIERPILKLATRPESGIPHLPSTVKETFNSASPLHHAWNKRVESFAQFCNSFAESVQLPLMLNSPRDQDPLPIDVGTGPDFSVDPKPHRPCDVALPEITDEQWVLDQKQNVVFCCKATHKLPEVIVMKG